MDHHTGTISDWNEDKGFGFITPQHAGRSIFFHINDYSRKHKRPVKGLAVQFLTSRDASGRPCAVHVVPANGHKANGREIRQQALALLLSFGFACVLYYLHMSGGLPRELLWWYGGTSILTFLFYTKDKNAAQRGAWRTPENTLHLLALFGGWPGAAVAQAFLRHKSSKVPFRIMFWVTTCANCGALYWLTTPAGTVWLRHAVRAVH